MPALPEAFRRSLFEALEKRRKQGRLWALEPSSKFTGTADFISNDFLSLSPSGVLRQETLNEIARNPDFRVGAGASRVADGTTDYMVQLEEWLANFHNGESALLFNSGFDANTAIFGTLPQPTDIILHDSLIHASVHDGMRKSRAAIKRPFAHNQPSSLRDVLLDIMEQDPSVAEGRRTVFVSIESIYSMDGDIAAAREMVECVKQCLPRKNVIFVVDEAHSSGIMGPQGKGFISHFGLENEFAIRLHTFGKGMGASGAVVICNPLVKSTLVNYARNFLFTTGPGFLTLSAVRASYNIISSPEGDKRRERLQSRIRYFYQCLTQHPQWPLASSNGELWISTADGWQDREFFSPILPLHTGVGMCRDLSSTLGASGFRVVAVDFPIVPVGEERVRSIIHADNSEAEIEGVVNAVVTWAAGKAPKANGH